MIRVTDGQLECIRDHFPEENIADGNQRAVTPLINNIIGKMEACEAIVETLRATLIVSSRSPWRFCGRLP
jgi:hypothetical protein